MGVGTKAIIIAEVEERKREEKRREDEIVEWSVIATDNIVSGPYYPYAKMSTLS